MKKILLSLASIGLLSAVIGISVAYWNDTATADQNTFNTGTMDLKVNDFDSVSAVFGGNNLKPGEWIPEKFLNVKNNGTIDGNHLDLLVTLSGDTDLARYMVFSTSNPNGLRFGSGKGGPESVRFDVPGWTAGDLEYGVRNGTDGTYIYGPQGADGNPTGAGNGMDRDGDGKVTLADLAVGKIRISPANVNAGITTGTTATLWMNTQVDPNTPNTMQGKTVTATFTWILDQDASQY